MTKPWFKSWIYRGFTACAICRGSCPEDGNGVVDFMANRFFFKLLPNQGFAEGDGDGVDHFAKGKWLLQEESFSKLERLADVRLAG